MKILKFGGTSLNKAENVKHVINLIKQQYQSCNELSIVVSAFGGVTDSLIDISSLAENRDSNYGSCLKSLEQRHYEIIDQLFTTRGSQKIKKIISNLWEELEDVVHGIYLIKELSKRSLDLIMSFGERLSAHIVTEYAVQSGLQAQFLDVRELVVTDDNFGSAKVDFEVTLKNISDYYKKQKGMKITTGFIASTEQGATTTLGRGGSDLTASIFGAALGADEIQIWTDVDGVMTADPEKVQDALSLDSLTYEEAMELSHFGANVLHPPAIQPALEKNITIRILNTFNTDFKGTILTKRLRSSDHLIKGISSIEDIALLRIQGSGMIGVPGIASRLFSALAKGRINVILISQASSEHSICIAVDPTIVNDAKKLIESEFTLEIDAHLIDNVIIERGLSIIAIVGENMQKTSGISGRLFSALGENGINVVAIAQGSSELNISVVVSKNDEIKSLNAIHEAFFLSESKSVNLFIVGTGLIGSTLLNRIEKDYDFFLKKQHIDFRVMALANINDMVLNESGIDLSDWENTLGKYQEKMDISNFIEKMKRMNLPHSIFVDCTASEEITEFYPEILKSNISIVTPNKIANIAAFEKHQELRELSKKHNTHFLYETNVGAGLPVISTLQGLLISGDIITKIEAILSGTLAYIFTSVNKNKSLSKVVKDAMEKGYTEPDPRTDLSGMDMAKKLLILVREMRVRMELDDIILERFLPDACFEVETVEDFLKELEKYDNRFEEKRKRAEEKGKVLRYIARYEDNKARISLEEVNVNHPFYFLEWSDNIIAFTTERYKETPLVIKGAGAGAEVTASGVLADIVKISNFLS
ncbi:MAG: bifunctional aspartate kinase/homoserine dehydrogenase I [Candidatus Marinimicrobia bacterium]|nr:bifunctional aspartate kinase/homoserine dehydrogenase I [Candidatus Neomarinimicrobiota bacterium]